MPQPKPEWLSRLSGMAVGEAIRIYSSTTQDAVRRNLRLFNKGVGWKFSVRAHKDGDGYLITRKG